MSDVINQENNAQSYDDDMIREDIVQTAVKFLQNPKVVNTPLAQKQKFLQRKGLNDKEIQAACERSGAYGLYENQTSSMPPPLPIIQRTYQVQQTSLFERFKEIVHTIGLISAVAYVIYMFYKKFIRPFLFGDKKKKSLEDSMNELTKSLSSSVEELKDNMATVKIEIERINQNVEMSTHRQLHDLKSEVNTVKGLLLSRKQFPSVSNSPVVPPSIPAWQLVSQQEQDPDTVDAKSEDLDIGSGSSSSEHEQGTKNSESSLEIM